MNAKGQYIIRKLFEAYYSNPQQLPSGPILHFMVDSERDINSKYFHYSDAKEVALGKLRTEFHERLKTSYTTIDKNVFNEKVILMRRICDHIASMTDHYAIQEYNNLYG